MQQLKLSSLLSPLSPFLFSRCLAFSPSPSLCHLTSSVSLVCLTNSKSPSLCPRSLCLPCQSPPLPTSSSSSPGFCPCHSPSLAYLLAFLFFQPPLPLYLSLSLSLSPTPTQSFLSLSHSLLCFPSTPSLLFCCCALACSSLLSLLRSSSSPPISPR